MTQIAYTRTGSESDFESPQYARVRQEHHSFYNLYFGDSWHVKPTFTLTYGLGWTLEMPPVEAQGKQIVLVDSKRETH